MILFKQEHLCPIYKGWKTETRRLWKKQRVKVASIHAIKTKLFEKDNHGFILIKSVRQENLLDISEKSALKEGLYTIKTYLHKWFEINPKSPPNPSVYVVEFSFVGFEPYTNAIKKEVG